MKTQRAGVLKSEWKLLFAGIAVACVIGYMAILGGATTWQYYLTVEECLTEAPSLPGRRIRVNGTITSGSLSVAKDRTSATFRLNGVQRNLAVVCSGPLPDNLAEDIQVVVQGELQTSGWLKGEQVLTRCASKYQSLPPAPAEVSESVGLRSVR
jgi:cytochrome c-type biogenesis protein CcmE